MEKDVVAKRNRIETSKMKEFIVKCRKRLQAILKRLQWNEENVLKSYNSNSCAAAKLSLDDAEPPLPESFTHNNSVVITKKQFREIVADPKAEIPHKFSELQQNFSRQQKLQIYEHVVKHTDKLLEPELSVPIRDGEKGSMTFAQIVAIKRRDRKQKRRKYRTSKPTHIEEVRNLVELQMQALEQYLKPSQISDSDRHKESRHGECTERGRSRGRKSSNGRRSCSNERRSRSRGRRSRSRGRRSRSRGRRSRSRGRRSRSRGRRSNSRCLKRRTSTVKEEYSNGRRKESASGSREVQRRRRRDQSRDKYYRSNSKEIRSRRRSNSREKRHKRSRSRKRDERNTSNTDKYSNDSKYDKRRRSRSHDRRHSHNRDKKDKNNNKGRSTEVKNKRDVEISRHDGSKRKFEKEKVEVKVEEKVKDEKEIEVEKEINNVQKEIKKETDMIVEVTVKLENVYESR